LSFVRLIWSKITDDRLIFPRFFFKTKDEQKVKHKTIFKTQQFTCTCEISYGRGNRTLKPATAEHYWCKKQ